MLNTSPLVKRRLEVLCHLFMQDCFRLYLSICPNSTHALINIISKSSSHSVLSISLTHWVCDLHRSMQLLDRQDGSMPHGPSRAPNQVVLPSQSMAWLPQHQSVTLSQLSNGVFFFFFFFLLSFQGRTHGIWRVPGQGSNRSCSCQLMPQPHQI